MALISKATIGVATANGNFSRIADLKPIAR
jgi:hypothetical protein